ncbi:MULTISPECIES: nicotinamide mononucleotide transporter family protein [Brevibacterium]|uniref:Nicotinamide mononucleotide transporter family protein n=1 Tax=Brevibacterium pityocampae TaxID=506594 RepID=A0ABP8JER1_9MICO|nr:MULTISPECIES: nicotinamide mononucleotide transporter family protein [unclassified Brevibacterium]MCK1802534.1 nicotinamide mononucleotide transporter family protein [Brevibacterium sp. R8603A2]QCP05872.1 nicotinamide mononucleotide transporter [Brevibacterium sp. CS2]
MEIFTWLNTPIFELLGNPVPWSDFLGNICALATVFLALRRNILSWPVQILGSILLFSASVSAGLGGNASRQVVIIVAAIWGWSQWKRSREQTGEIQVRWATWKERILLVLALLVGTVAFGAVLSAGGWSWNPYPDAYIFVGSLVAMYAQGRAIVEFWFVWLAVDLVGIPLAIMGGLAFSGIVYFIFLIMVVVGIIDWAKRSRQTISSPIAQSQTVTGRPD